MHRRLRVKAFLILSLLGALGAQPYVVGDTVGDFGARSCANADGDFSLSMYDGHLNGEDYSVIWLTFFASW